MFQKWNGLFKFKERVMTWLTRLRFLFIAALFFYGCTGKHDHKKININARIEKIVIDSIMEMDLLVQKNKIVDNALARSYAKKALILAQKSNSDEALARAMLMMGYSNRNYDDDTSLLYTNRALALAVKMKYTSITSIALYNLANFYYRAADLRSAIIYSDSAIKVFKQDGDFKMLSNTYNFLGGIKFDLNDTSGARIMYDSALQIARKHGFKLQEGVAMANKARFIADPKKMDGKLKDAVELLRGIQGAEEEIAEIYINLGMNSTNSDSALHFYDEAIKLANVLHLSDLRIAICNNQAYSYLEKNNWKRAEECLVSNAIPMAQREKKYSWLATLYDTYTDILIAGKNTEEALKYARLAYKTRGLAESSSAPKQLRLLTTLLDVKNKELMLAKNEKELRQQENKTKTIIIVFSVSALALAVLIFFILWRMQRNRLRYNATLLKAAKKIIEAEDRERTKIGRDFHDLTGQKFSGLSSYLENQEFPDSETKNIALKMLEEIRQAVREMSHRMNRAWVERFTLEESISGLCADCIRMAGLNLRFHAPEKYPVMARETKIHLFRIVQELLTNAMQHARTSNISLEISFDISHLYLKYSDDGPGFDKNAIKGHGTGLDNILERATLLDGIVELDTRPGYGTDYSIAIPLRRDKLSSGENKENK